MLAGALATAALWAAAPAQAQIPTPDPAVFAPDYARVITQDQLLRDALRQPGQKALRERERAKRRRNAKQRKRARARKPTAGQKAALGFEVDPAVTTNAENDFVDKFGAEGVAPELVLADVRKMRDAGLRDLDNFGWHSDHLGDVAAFTLVVATTFANGETRVSRSGAYAVRRQVTAELARSKRTRRLSDGRQQFAAELLLMRMAYSVGHVNYQRQVGDAGLAAEELGRLRDLIETTFGVDPSDVRITAKGLAER